MFPVSGRIVTLESIHTLRCGVVRPRLLLSSNDKMYLNGKIMKIKWRREWNFIVSCWICTFVYLYNASYNDDNGFYLHFAGQVTIEFHVEKETNFIVLHIQDLNITEKVIFFF